jgi:hypothetical protein
MTTKQFHQVSAVVSGETGSKGNRIEMVWIAHDIKNRGERYGGRNMYQTATQPGWYNANDPKRNPVTKGYLNSPHSAAGKNHRNETARAAVIDALFNPNDPTSGRTMHEGNVFLGHPPLQEGSNFQEKFIDEGVAYDPIKVGETTVFMERSKAEAAKWRAQQKEE